MTTLSSRKTWPSQRASRSYSSFFQHTPALNTTNRRLLATSKVASKMTTEQYDAHVAKFQAEVAQSQQELGNFLLERALAM